MTNELEVKKELAPETIDRGVKLIERLIQEAATSELKAYRAFARDWVKIYGDRSLDSVGQVAAAVKGDYKIATSTLRGAIRTYQIYPESIQEEMVAEAKKNGIILSYSHLKVLAELFGKDDAKRKELEHLVVTEKTSVRDLEAQAPGKVERERLSSTPVKALGAPSETIDNNFWESLNKTDDFLIQSVRVALNSKDDNAIATMRQCLLDKKALIETQLNIIEKSKGKIEPRRNSRFMQVEEEDYFEV